MSDLLAKLNKALKPQGNKNSVGSFRHENESAILEAAIKLLSISEAGSELIAYAKQHEISMHVLRNKQDFGVLPDQKAVFVSCPAGVMMPTSRVVLRLAGALRDAMQSENGAFPRPDVRAGKERYVHAKLNKAADVALWQTAVAYEIHEKTGLLEIIDELFSMGYRSIYEGYKADQEASLS